MAETDRGKFATHLQFVLSAVGYSVGLGNVWRFPYLTYKNGGGAFLIPYLISVVLAGLPLYALELSLGQFSSLGPASVFLRLTPLFQGLGWAMVIISFNMSLYYNMIIAWVIFYFVLSFRSELPWKSCGNAWNTNECGSTLEDKRCGVELNVTDAVFMNGTCQIGNATLSHRVLPSDEFYHYYVLGYGSDVSYHNLGGINWPIAGCLAAAWLLVFLCLYGGVQTSGRVVYFTALFPYAILFLMLIRGLTLPGAMDGIRYYFTPQTDKLTNLQVWRTAAVQVFYSLGPGEGGLITLSSYNKFDNNFIRDAYIVTGVDTFTSSFAGFTTFSILGHAAHLLDTEVANVTKSGPALAFVIFPQVLASMSFGPFWSVMFFLMLITLGLDSQFVLHETVVTSLLDQFPVLAPCKTCVVGIGCVVCFLLGLPFCTRGGILLFTLWDDYSSGYSVMLVVLYETSIICWMYGLKNILKDIEQMLGYTLGSYWRFCWMFVTPIYMLFIFTSTLIEYEPSQFNDVVLPVDAQSLGWLLSAMPLMAILFFCLHRVLFDVYHRKKTWTSLITVSAHWCPKVDQSVNVIRHTGKSRLHLLEYQQPQQPMTRRDSIVNVKTAKEPEPESER